MNRGGEHESQARVVGCVGVPWEAEVGPPFTLPHQGRTGPDS